MIKTVKGKVIAGTMVFGLVTGAGVAFGATDAGTNLKAWYDGQFGLSSKAGIEEATGYGLDEAGKWATEYTTLKTGATTSILGKGTSETVTATGKIDAQSKEHIKAINDQQKIIEGYLAAQFDKLTFEANKAINAAGNAAVLGAGIELGFSTGKAGKDALSLLKGDLGTATTKAVGELEATINTAKTELQGQLTAEKDTTVTEIKGLIDKKIIELRGKITGIKDGLVTYHEGLITAEANRLQLEAENQMKALVEGIK